jgi:molybdopterin-guanine dinucleotide biosynthesis protein A
MSANREQPSPPPGKETITGVILAGGRGSRMGGMDKGLVELAGRPMVEHVATRLRPQVRDLLVSANRNRERYEALGFRVVADRVEGYQGPLAGMAAALHAAATPWAVTVPCDSPLIGSGLVARLSEALIAENAELAVAHDGSRAHPVFLLLARALLPSLTAFLAAGERKIDRWFARHRVATAVFADSPETFLNVNDPQEHRALEARLRSGP